MKKIFSLLLVLLFVHLLILVATRFTAWPEMFSYPYFMSKGFFLYKDIALPYEPILPIFLLSVYKLFGFNILVLQITTWLIILTSDILIFIISFKLIGKKLSSLVPVLLYICLQPFMDGNMLWFDLATVPLILAAITSFMFLKGKKRFILFGLFLGLSFFIKQQLGIVLVLLFLYFLLKKQSFKDLIGFCLGFSIPAIFVASYVFLNNLLSSYLFWSIEVPIIWYPKFPGYVSLPSLNQIVIMVFIFSAFLGAVIKMYKKREENLLVSGLIFLGLFIAAFPRFEFFRLQPAIATFMVLIALVFPKDKKSRLLIIIPIALVSLVLIKHSIPSINQPPRFYDNSDIALSKIINVTSNKQNNIYLLGISSLQYVLTFKTTSSPWVDNYIWYLEIPGIQENVINGFNHNPPQIIYRKIPQLGNWYDLGVYQPKKIVEYIKNNYDEEGGIQNGIEIWTRKK